MSVQRFLIYIRFSTICPQGISPMRWRAMLAWLEVRRTLAEPFEF